MLGSKCKDAHNLFDFHVEEKFVQILFDFCPEDNLPFSQDMVKFTEKELDIWFMLNDENFTASLDWEHVDDDDDPDDDDDEDALASHDMGHGSHPSSII